ncbi:MAG: potassium channel family protein [Planctomycetaceae bacterium]
MQGRTTTMLIRRLRWVLLALAGVVVYGVGGYMLLERWSFEDALYMTVMTMTTVGFREVRPLDTGGRMFTLTLIVLGVGIALVGVSLAAAVIAEGELGGNTRRRRMTKRIDGLHDHFIVCAYGRVGRTAVRELQAAGLPFVVVDPNEELRERMEADDVPYLVDDPSNEPVLRQAGIDRARGLICAVDSDATNVYITLTARSINPDLFIVARASERGTAERLERAGANRVVSPFVSSGRHMVRMAIDPSIVDVFDETARSIPVAERLVAAGSDLEGVQVGAAGASILALRRADGSTVASPSADTTIHAGDVVLLLGS